MTSPVRLQVSPTAATTPTGVFNHRFEALFPCTGTLGCEVCSPPQVFLLVYLHMIVGQAVPPAGASRCPPATALPTQVLQLLPCCEYSPRLPISAPPTCLGECFFFNSLVVWLHTVRFSVSYGCFLFLNLLCPPFGCVRRHSVSTNAFILARSQRKL